MIQTIPIPQHLTKLVHTTLGPDVLTLPESVDTNPFESNLPYSGMWRVIGSVNVSKTPLVGHAQTTVKPDICQGHFSDRIIVPGVVLAELANQVAANSIAGIVGGDFTPFLLEFSGKPKAPIHPGNVLDIYVAYTGGTGRKLRLPFVSCIVDESGQVVYEGSLVGGAMQSNRIVPLTM